MKQTLQQPNGTCNLMPLDVEEEWQSACSELIAALEECARLRRWDHHTSCVDLAWEAAVAPRGAS